MGNFLDGRYAVLDALGRDGPYERFVAFDMLDMRRVHVRILHTDMERDPPPFETIHEDAEWIAEEQSAAESAKSECVAANDADEASTVPWEMVEAFLAIPPDLFSSKAEAEASPAAKRAEHSNERSTQPASDADTKPADGVDANPPPAYLSQKSARRPRPNMEPTIVPENRSLLEMISGLLTGLVALWIVSQFLG